MLDWLVPFLLAWALALALAWISFTLAFRYSFSLLNVSFCCKCCLFDYCNFDFSPYKLSITVLNWIAYLCNLLTYFSEFLILLFRSFCSLCHWDFKTAIFYSWDKIKAYLFLFSDAKVWSYLWSWVTFYVNKFCSVSSKATFYWLLCSPTFWFWIYCIFSLSWLFRD